METQQEDIELQEGDAELSHVEYLDLPFEITEKAESEEVDDSWGDT